MMIEEVKNKKNRRCQELAVMSHFSSRLHLTSTLMDANVSSTGYAYKLSKKGGNYKQNCCQQRCKNFSYVIIFVSSAFIPLNFKQNFIRQL